MLRLTTAQIETKEKKHKIRMTQQQLRIIKEKRNNRVIAMVKFFVMFFSYLMSYFTCNIFSNLSISYFVMSLTIGSDMFIILLTTNKSGRQYGVSFVVTAYSIIITIFFFFSCTNLITYDSKLHELIMGSNIAFNITWGHLKFLSMIFIFILICTYSLEHTGILKMPSYRSSLAKGD